MDQKTFEFIQSVSDKKTRERDESAKKLDEAVLDLKKLNDQVIKDAWFLCPNDQSVRLTHNVVISPSGIHATYENISLDVINNIENAVFAYYKTFANNVL